MVDNQIFRIWKTRLPQHYLAAAASDLLPTKFSLHANSFLGGGDLLNEQSLPVEFMMNALRLSQGVPQDFFHHRTGLDWSVVQTIWSQLEAKQLVIKKDGRIATTELGQRYLNRVLQAFMRDDSI